MHRERVKAIIDKIPGNSTLEDIQYTIYVQSKIEKGLEAAKKRRCSIPK